MILLTGDLGFIRANLINNINTKFIVIENSRFFKRINYIKNKKIKSIINIGTSKPRSFFDVAKLVCKYMNKKEILVKDIPSNIKKNYQYITYSNNQLLEKLKLINNFTTLESGIKKYIRQLKKHTFFKIDDKSSLTITISKKFNLF